MPNNCSSMVKKISYSFFVFLLISCVGIDNYSNSVTYKGKVLFNSAESEQYSFNILLNSNKNNIIIQIYRPLYGNFIQIKYDNATNVMKYITKEGSYKINSAIPNNIEELLNNCILNESYTYKGSENNPDFNLKCFYQDKRMNFYLEYKNSFYEGFLIKNE